MHIVCHAILRTVDGKFLLQRRDRKPGILGPGLVSFFGGSLEGDETPEECVIRELDEELTLEVQPEDLQLIWKTTHFAEEQHSLWYVYMLCDITTDTLELHEGAGMEVLTFDEMQEHPLIMDTIKEGLREHESDLCSTLQRKVYFSDVLTGDQEGVG